MPVGWLPGDGGDGGRRPPSPPPRPPRVPPRAPDTPLEEPWDRWREAIPVIWQVWRTNGDERVCPICGPLAGLEFLAGEGPQPPLHPNCRCEREVSRVEWVLRET
jgi:hypothetical protein